MPASLNINDILSKVKELGKEEQFTLMERLVALLKRNETVRKPVKLSKISGVGSKIWEKNNIDEYIEQERQW
jgi:hypothetical protein